MPSPQANPVPGRATRRRVDLEDGRALTIAGRGPGNPVVVTIENRKGAAMASIPLQPDELRDALRALAEVSS